LSIEPSKFLVNKDGSLTEVYGHTFRVKFGRGLPLPEDIEIAIVWVLAREWDGSYFTFSTELEYGVPIRVLKAMCWFSKEEDISTKTKMTLRMAELVKMGESFVSVGGFLANVCNRDMRTEMVRETYTMDGSEVWIGKGGN
jgi:formylmethanofuran dehydrogenase subunit B